MWFWYGLVGAIASAISVTYNKKLLTGGIRASTLSWFLFVFSIPIILIFSFRLGFPNVNLFFILAVLAAGIAFSAAKTLQLHLFKHHALSEIYSLQSISPLTLYLFGLIFLSEKVTPAALAGIVVMAVGIYLLKFERGNKNIFHPITAILKTRSALLYLAVIFLSNLTAVSEKFALRNMASVKNPLYVTLWETVMILFFTSLFMIKRNREWAKEVKENFWSLSLAGLVYFFVSASVIWGFREGPIALVSSIKKLEVLFVMILSYVFFKERPSRYVYLGVILALVATVLIKL